jgi:purine-binding chemotaxis protein CheW
MADARKKAKQKDGGATPPAEPPATAHVPEETAPSPARDEHEEPAVRETAPEPEPEPLVREPERDSAFSSPRWVSSEETLTFPSEPYSAPGPPSATDTIEPIAPPRAATGHGRIALPSSGLASDILAREDALQIESLPLPVSPMPALVAATPEAVSVAARPQSSALFGHSRDERKAAPELMEHLVTFYLADEEYALDVRTVQEIIRMAETTHVPRAPEFIKGVINLRGRIIPVVDLKKKLALGEVAPSRQSRIVVVKIRERLIGLLVDGASQVLKIPVSAIDAAPEEILDVSASFIRGVAKMEKRLIILLDLYKILAIELEHAIAQ